LFKRALLGIIFITSLSGCEVPVMMAAKANQGEMVGMFEIKFPAVLLVQIEDGTEELLKGHLLGHINGSAKFDLTGPTWGECTGASTKAGKTSLSCANGISLSMNTGKQKAKMSGLNVVAGQSLGHKFISAFGWGNDADEAKARLALEEHS